MHANLSDLTTWASPEEQRLAAMLMFVPSPPLGLLLLIYMHITTHII